MIVVDVLRIQGEAQILVVLIGNPHDPALEVERVLVHVDVWLPPVEHAEDCQRSIGNMIMAEEGEALFRRPPVVQQRLRQGGYVIPAGVMDHRSARARACSLRSGGRRRDASGYSESVARTAAREHVADVEGVV